MALGEDLRNLLITFSPAEFSTPDNFSLLPKLVELDIKCSAWVPEKTPFSFPAWGAWLLSNETNRLDMCLGDTLCVDPV